MDPMRMMHQGQAGIEKMEGQWLQLLLIFLVPVFIAVMSSQKDAWILKFRKIMNYFRGEVVREIAHISSSNYYFQFRQDNRNNILQKAIFMFMSHSRSDMINNRHLGQFRLMQSGEEKNVGWNQEMTGQRSSEQLKKFAVNTLPDNKEWTEVAKGVWFFYDENVIDVPGGEEIRTAHNMIFKAYGKGAHQKIDAFISECYKYYIEQLRKEMDTARYLYVMQLGMKKSEDKDAPPVFKKYKLGEEKTFDSLFFPQKKEMLKLIDDFMEEREKFAIEGFPKKLGLLLHGPPGTGKTSFVKALAKYTKRHIVNVPLGKIQTNQELYDIMFEMVFPCPGDDGVAQKFDFKDIIFLMEDIDCATDIVKARGKKSADEVTTLEKNQQKTFVLDKEDAAEGKPAAEGEKGIDDDDGAVKKSGSLVASASGAHKKEKKSKKKGGNGDGLDGLEVIPGENGEVLIGAESDNGNSVATGGGLDLEALLGPKADKLDLAGLLNVLDGVVDSPQRIVIMTTNHPEKLDPALIRPGRINQKLHLSFMTKEDMQLMLEHHFQKFTPAQEKRLARICQEPAEGEKPLTMTGAEVEQLCAEHDELEEVLETLAGVVEPASGMFDTAFNLPGHALLGRQPSMSLEALSSQRSVSYEALMHSESTSKTPTPSARKK